MLTHSSIDSTPLGALRRRSSIEVRQQLADRVRAHRIARDWTQREVAARAGMAFETYRLFERTGRVSLDRFLRLLDLLGLLDRIDFPAPDTRSIDDVLSQAAPTPRQRVGARRA